MNAKSLPCLAAASLLGLLLSGCYSTQQTHSTNQKHPGPAVGTAVGTGVGVVAGNVVGTAVGVVEGTAQGVAAPFNNETRTVRVWREVKTSDGRTVKVPVDIPVDANGQPLQQ